MTGEHRTTMRFDDETMSSMAYLSDKSGASNTEVVRRSVRLMIELVQFQDEGGQIHLVKGRKKERIRFVWEDDKKKERR